ncbi:hypothetical protein EYF80_048416 [Liparis tanakae]|uniref:Uncharacterized protein n=1 Tax=Liparis tanakae TaxID=230148 RepID=A0A4Z2FKX0_9TELE|nr:hypothetical protein EYF80_048416 [Liparis tanakae]
MGQKEVTLSCQSTEGDTQTLADGLTFQKKLLPAGGVAGVLTVVTTTLGAGVDPDGLSRGNHLAARRVDVAVRTWREMSDGGAVLLPGH